MLKVVSLTRAREFLRENGMLGGITDRTLIELPNGRGVEIQLVE